MKEYFCVVVDVHVYYSTNERKAAKFRDKHKPNQELLVTCYPETYGYPHRIP